MIFTRLILFALAWEIYTLFREADSFFEQIGAVITATLCSYVGSDFLEWMTRD